MPKCWPLLLALCCIAAWAVRAQANDTQAGAVAAIFSNKCFACHGADEKKRKAGLDLRTRESALRGGESGPAIVPGDPENSPLYIAVTRREEEFSMPPKENDALSSEQVTLIREWIAGGAKWPDEKIARARAGAAATTKWSDDVADGVVVATSGGLSSDWDDRKYAPADLWAYQPVKSSAVPHGAPHPVDAFIQQTLREKGVTSVAPAADKRTLIRRVTFDLTGLPPTPDELAAFLNDESPGAYERLIDRLLASPRYGEQQARHWLDVVRYADTGGFSNDFERPNAWRYRDYVIRSFNNDKPYDRFIVEQLAGDELDASDPEMLLATGYLRTGPWEHTDMTVAAVTRQQWLNDVTQSVGVTFLAQQLRCASCHDHKFDPVPTRDFYRIQAVFASTQFQERPAVFVESENLSGAADAKAAIERRLEESKRVWQALQRKNQQAVAAYVKEKGVKTFDELRQEGQPNKGELGLSKQELSIRKIYKKRMEYFERELERFEPLAFAVYSGPTNGYSSVRREPAAQERREKQGKGERPIAVVPIVHILIGGALESPGQAVTPGVLSAVHASRDVAVPDTTSGRRLALARWIANSNNTLTARVIVNRIWQQHFGTGLVATPNNFGKMGGRPTHPELLDYLADWFVENGWSIKKLHRLIVTSATYAQAGEHPEMAKLTEFDAKNQLLGYFPPRRLVAEEIRDAMLVASGELNDEMGGPGVFPEMNWEVAFQPRHIMGSVAPAYQPSPTPAERNRRTIYAFRYRTLSDPMLEVLNRPGSETSCERRDETTVTPQVFALFNSEFSHARALAMAASLRHGASSLDEQIASAFRRVYGRRPSDDELKKSAAHVAKMLEHHRSQQPPPTTLPTKIARHMVEEMTGEEVSWDEELDGMKDYQRDLTPSEVDAETRALAELCLVLMNSNEFLYVR